MKPDFEKICTPICTTVDLSSEMDSRISTNTVVQKGRLMNTILCVDPVRKLARIPRRIFLSWKISICFS